MGIMKKEKINIQFVIFLFTIVLLLLVYRSPVFADTYTQRNFCVTDSNSPLYGKNVRLFYDSDGCLVQDTQNIIGNRSNYEIFVNKRTNVVTIYAVDKGVYIPVKRFVCSNGGGNTPEGNFYTPNKYRWHELMGPSWGQWCEHLTDDILFHSVYYNKERDNKSLSVSAYNKLGTMASHGCVRLTAGDAKWIYDNCKIGTKVIIYNNKKNPGPFDKPKAQKLSSSHTWDPTDPTIK